LPELSPPDIWLKALVPNNRIDLPRIRMLLQWLEQRLTAANHWDLPRDGGTHS